MVSDAAAEVTDQLCVELLSLGNFIQQVLVLLLCQKYLHLLSPAPKRLVVSVGLLAGNASKQLLGLCGVADTESIQRLELLI